MKFSIIIPCYNHAEFVAQSIQSALDQTMKCEVIVINDGSTDKSLDVIKQFEKEVTIINQVNKGLSSARNSGIMSATGDYVLPLDSDDLLLEECVERLHAAAVSTDADVISPSFRTFDKQKADIILTEVPTLQSFKEANRLPYFSAIKRTLLQEVGGYSPKMTWGYEDYHLWFDIFKRNKKVCVLLDILVLYRVKERSMIHDAQAHHNELMAQIIKDHKEVWM